MGVGRMGRSPTLGPRRGSKQVNSRRQDHFSTSSPHSFLSPLHVPHTCTNVRRTSQGKIGGERNRLLARPSPFPLFSLAKANLLPRKKWEKRTPMDIKFVEHKKSYSS